MEHVQIKPIEFIPEHLTAASFVLSIEPAYTPAGKSVKTVLTELGDKCQDTNEPTRPTGTMDAIFVGVSADSLTQLNQYLTELNHVFTLPLTRVIAEKTRLNLTQSEYNRFIKVAPQSMHFITQAQVSSLHSLAFKKLDALVQTTAIENQSITLKEKLTALADKKKAYVKALDTTPVNIQINAHTEFFSGQSLAELGDSIKAVTLDDKPHAMGLLMMSETGKLDLLKEVLGL